MAKKNIGKFAVEYFQVLNENGQIDAKLDPGLTDEQLLELYRAMVLAREADQRMLKLQRQGRLGTIPVCTGQEASACAATLAMEENDWFVGSYRELGGRLMRGEPLINSMLIYNGYEEGNVVPGNDRTLPISIVLGSQLPHAVGLAYASQMRGETDTAAVAFFGDGSTSQGDFHEALNFAAVWNTPVVFVCQNNQWAISTPRNKQTKAQSIAQKAIAYDIPGVQIDGNDALAVYKATKEALDRAKAGGGPTLIEAMTYRMSVHTTADDPTRYRSADEVKAWEKKDPIERFRKYLVKRELLTDESNEKISAEVKAEVEKAVKEFEGISDFKMDAPFDFTFETEVPELESQRQRFLDELRKESENA